MYIIEQMCSTCIDHFFQMKRNDFKTYTDYAILPNTS